MTHTELKQSLDRDLDTRYSEIDDIRKSIPVSLPVADQDRRRRPLVLLLYAHLEGFCVFALREYVRVVNFKKLTCHEVAPAVLAGAWSRLFADMNSDAKCDFFGSKLTEDASLNRHWRRRKFVTEMNQCLAQTVRLHEDIIRSDWNLNAVVLMRNLFVVGVSYNFVKPFEQSLSGLLGRRNAISHGNDVGGIELAKYKEYEDCFLEVTCRLIDHLVEAVETEQYSRAVSLGWPPGL